MLKGAFKTFHDISPRKKCDAYTNAESSRNFNSSKLLLQLKCFKLQLQIMKSKFKKENTELKRNSPALSSAQVDCLIKKGWWLQYDIDKALIFRSISKRGY